LCDAAHSSQNCWRPRNVDSNRRRDCSPQRSGILYTSNDRIPVMSSSSRTARRLSPAEPPGVASRSVQAPRVEPIATIESFKSRAYTALKDAIAAMDIYSTPSEIRLDERKLAIDFGISRTPVREAMAQLEREGFVRAVPRRGSYVVRKTKREVVEMITAWAALESMAARLITQDAKTSDIASLRAMF